MNELLAELQQQIESEIKTDNTTLILYSTDASVYRERPLGVIYPKSEKEVQTIIKFCNNYKINIIFRGAGTSLAGQCVGKGLVVDCSKNFNKIISVDKINKTVRVQTGVVRDELNNYLKPYGLFFAPETSTSNRCTIGGMVGNNSCGLHSVSWGTTRENIENLRCILADGKIVDFHTLNNEEIIAKTKQEDLEGKIYSHIYKIASDKTTKEKIKSSFPDRSVIRRNNGYALDEVLDLNNINLSRLIAGSEGTLCYISEITLKLRELPYENRAAICVHFNTLQESFLANLVCIKYKPIAVELMDRTIIESAKRNKEQNDNLFFLRGNPAAVIVDELCFETKEELQKAIDNTISELKTSHLGYDYVIVDGLKNISKVWALRKAGLGLLNNVPGDMKPTSVIEDTAVACNELPAYMEDFQELLKKYGLSCVFYAHIASGELHLRPILNLKVKKDVQMFRTILTEVAKLVKKHHGSLSGEHGDGRLRGEFIPFMYGEEVYQIMKDIKDIFDKNNIFNQGKIIDTPLIDKNLRFDAYLEAEKEGKTIANQTIKTYYSFEKEKGFLTAIEQCNGAGVCRKSTQFGGSMCPSYRISERDERFSTRARANILREVLTYGKDNPFKNKEIKTLLDDCLMCKGCKRECPSNVDMTKLKSEYLQHWYDNNGTPFYIWAMSYLPLWEKIGSIAPTIYNYLICKSPANKIIKNIMGFAPERKLPTLNATTMRKDFSIITKEDSPKISVKSYVYILADEFTNNQDSKIGDAFVKLLIRLGYEVRLAPIENCGRILFSKGLVKRGKRLANKNIALIENLVSEEHPLVGIEPSAILSFRDEYPLLVYGDISNITKHCLCFDEFIAREMDKGNISSDSFTMNSAKIIYHTHCQQKAIIGEKYMQKILSLPKNYIVNVIPSGCCGMAGSFGYEKKHYKQSEAIVHQVLMPAVMNADDDTIICASGTSCREQILHFTHKKALHPVEILYNALK